MAKAGTTVVLKQGKETKNCVRYESVDANEPLAFDTLYIQKWAARQMSQNGGFPATIKVTIEAG